MGRRMDFVFFWAAMILAMSNSAEGMGPMGGENATVFFCRSPTGKTPIPLPNNFPPRFAVSIEAVYYANDTQARLSDLEQSIDKNNNKNLAAVTRFEGGIRYQYIFNTTSKTYSFVNDSAKCVAEINLQALAAAKSPENDPILLPNNQTEGWLNNATSVLDVWAWAANDPKDIYKDESETGHHEHGVAVDHYYVCKKSGDYVLEIEICLTAQTVKMPFPGMNVSLPLRIDIKRYYNGASSDNKTTIEQFVGYRLSGYRNISNESSEEAFLPPPGVPCENVSSVQPKMPDFPTNFGVHMDYIDEEGRKIDSSELRVDLDAHVMALQYTSNDSSIPLTEHALLPVGKYKIVHDFIYGLEYIIDVNSDACLNVSAIPNNAADAAYDESAQGRAMKLKNASALLGIDLDNATVYYVGERFLGSVPCDVWLAYVVETETSQKQVRQKTIVHEVYFSQPDWKLLTGNAVSTKPTLLAVKKYNWVDPGENKPTHVNTTLFHDFVTYPQSLTHWNDYDVTPCLNFSRNDSYLLAFANDTLVNVNKNGRKPIENALRSEIAKAANVSQLRVANFYFEAVNDTVWVFFFIADQPSVNGSKTMWYNESITVKDAREILNKSLNNNAIVAKVPVGDGANYYVVALSKGSLAAVPPLFSPPIVKNVIDGRSGYSGSSMAALGICMLLIGGVLGLVLAFFMWKRNRAGSGAPVYYTNKPSA